VALEGIDRGKGLFCHLPLLIHLIKIVDAIYCIRLVDGGNQRINQLKDELCTLVHNLQHGTAQQRKTSPQEIIKKIVSYGDEFELDYTLNKLYASLKVNRQKGPDFMLDDLGIKIEAKSKLNRNYLGDISNPAIQLDKMTCLKLVSKDVFESGRLAKAFEDQDTDIAFMNVSHSQFGSLFASHAYGLNNLNLTLQEAFEGAIKIARSNDKAVVIYSEQVSYEQPYSICAIVSDKSMIEYYGSRLDKIQKDLKINTATTDGYYRLIEEARKLK
jgi:hypothetical protein